MGNLRSVYQALKQVAPNTEIVIARTAAEIQQAQRVVLPGQGAMPDCMKHLQVSGLLEAVLSAAKTKPLLGICVGEQMLFDSRRNVCNDRNCNRYFARRQTALFDGRGNTNKYFGKYCLRN